MFARIAAWLEQYLRPAVEQLSWRRLALYALLIVVVAGGVRWFQWRDFHIEIASAWHPLGYDSEAARILGGGGLLFPRELPAPGDARMLVHPPGYGLLMAAVTVGAQAASINDEDALVIVQLLLDALACLLLFFLARKFFPPAIALTAALLAACSPHLAYYSLIRSPDSISVLPLLAAMIFFINVARAPRGQLRAAAASGFFIGISCWLRANAMLLAPGLALILIIMSPRASRWRAAAVLTLTMLIVIMPITLRNLIVFHERAPISIGAGAVLLEGITDFDPERRFGMPADDQEVASYDAKWYGRPEYANNQWIPDGFERERGRIARGLVVIKANPGWFAAVMIERAAFMLRYNSNGAYRWPFNTAVVAIVAADAPFDHRLPPAGAPRWSADGAQLFAIGHTLSAQAAAVFDNSSNIIKISGDDADYGDQYAFAPIRVEPNNDYLLTLQAELIDGQAAIKVMSADNRTVLANAILAAPNHKNAEPDNALNMPVNIHFAGGNRDEIKIVVSNNGGQRARVNVSSVQLYQLGATPHRWTHYPRLLARAIQKNIFVTTRMLPLVMAGILILILLRRGRELLILVAVPGYFLATQSALHTEYRYVLAIHYFLFIIAAIALCSAAAALRQVLGRRGRAKN